MKIGIDIGNVIIGGGGEDTFFTEKFLDTPELKDAFGSMLDLKSAGHEIHLISKCGESVEKKSLEWLFSWGYFYIIPQHRIHFVRKRHLKAPMAMALELDIFIDDREDVLRYMGTVNHRILFTSWEQTNKELAEIFAKAAEG